MYFENEQSVKVSTCYVLGLFLLIFFVLFVVFLSLYVNKEYGKNKVVEKFIPNTSIDNVYYINLDHRPDRKAHVLNELKKIGYDSSKIHRVKGIIDKFGALGCSKSHLKALNMAEKNKDNIFMIVEDDFTCTKPETFLENIEEFFNLNIDWDVLITSAWIKRYKTISKKLVKVIECQTTGGYIVHAPFSPILRENFTKGIQNLEQYSKQIHEYCIDQYWKHIQPQHNWYSIVPILGFQKEGFSDIEEKHVNYSEIKEFEINDENI